jgi:hypothetical protein
MSTSFIIGIVLLSIFMILVIVFIIWYFVYRKRIVSNLTTHELENQSAKYFNNYANMNSVYSQNIETFNTPMDIKYDDGY